MFYPPELKAEVVQFLLNNGIIKTLQTYKIPKSTIYYWLYQLNQKNRFKNIKILNNRIDPRLIIFIHNVNELFPTLSSNKLKQLCDKYSFINNTSYISVSSIARIIKKIRAEKDC